MCILRMPDIFYNVPVLQTVNEQCLTWNKSCMKKYQKKKGINSSPPSAAYMRQWIGSALVQIMACRLNGAKPLSEPMLEYC